MKKIEIKLFDINDDGLIYQATHRMSYDTYKEFLIRNKQNFLEDIINELEFKINTSKNGDKEN